MHGRPSEHLKPGSLRSESYSVVQAGRAWERQAGVSASWNQSLNSTLRGQEASPRDPDRTTCQECLKIAPSTLLTACVPLPG
jgi:hypothetical protein